MCFESWVAIDSTTRSQHIPASACVDPNSMPFHALANVALEVKVTVTLFHLGNTNSYRQAWADDTWNTNLNRCLNESQFPVELPVLNALLEHESMGEKGLWDLGMCSVSRI